MWKRQQVSEEGNTNGGGRENRCVRKRIQVREEEREQVCVKERTGE